MTWPHYKPVVTVVDLLDCGACYDGVCKEVVRQHGAIIAETQKLIKHAEWTHIATAANADGYGDSYGSGYGSGYGDGDGYGDGYGYGYGDDDGSGE